MSDLQQRQLAVDTVFEMYDAKGTGYLTPEQLRCVHSDMRMGGISQQQVIAAMAYTCADTESCDKTELFDMLQEMDRRYYLLEGFRWEFTSLDYSQTDTISEEHAKWFVQNVHGEYFSRLRWDNFLRTRAAPKTGVSFPEIEVMLCDIPSKEEFEQEQLMLKKLQKDKLQKQEDDLNRILAEKERRQKERDKNYLAKLKQDERRLRDEEKRHNQEEAERSQHEKERLALEKREQALKEAEEKGRLEDLQRQHMGDLKDMRHDDIAAMQALLALQSKTKEEEERWQREALDAPNIEKQLKRAEEDEQKAKEEATKANKEAKAAEEGRDRKEAEEIEKEAAIRAKEAQNKKVRLNLKLHVKTRDTQKLPPAIKSFKKSKLPDSEGDLAKGEKIMKEEQAREKLARAMDNRNLKELEKAVAFAKRGGFELVLSNELVDAHKLIIQLRRLERIRAEILELKQSTVAEIRSYQKPPEIVHHVMTATFLLLDHKERETALWKTVQALVGKTGKEGLKRRCLECTPQKVNADYAKRAKQIYEQFGLDDVRDVSAGAATFFLWGTTMIEEKEAIEAAKAREAEKKAKMKAKKAKLKKMIAEKEREEKEKAEKEKAEEEQAENAEATGET